MPNISQSELFSPLGKLSQSASRTASRRTGLLGGLSLSSLVAACGEGSPGGSAGTSSASISGDFTPTATAMRASGGSKTVYVGTSGNNTYNNQTLTQSTTDPERYIDALGGDDTITTGNNDDIIRGGSGKDTINAGAGDDIILMVGTTSDGQYNNAWLDTTFEETSELFLSADDLSSDVVAGETVNGGAGTDSLYTVGTIDISKVSLTSIETLNATGGDVTLDVGQLVTNGGSLATLGSGTLRLTTTSTSEVRVDLSQLTLQNNYHIELGENVVLEVGSSGELTGIKSDLKITGNGVVHVTGTGQSLSTLSIADGVTVREGAQGSETVSSNKLGSTIIDSSKPVYSAPSGTTTPGTVYFVENSTAAVTWGSFSDDVAVTSYTLSGTDLSAFSITSAGVLTFNTVPDYETKTSYNISIEASDGANTTSQALTIEIRDIDEAAPTYSGTPTATVNENSTAAISWGAFTDTDKALVYTLGGDDAALFEISVTGELKFKAAPDFEAPADSGGNNVYDITITAKDSLDNESAAQAIAITVTDVADEAPPTYSAPTASPSVIENSTAAVNWGSFNDIGY